METYTIAEARRLLKLSPGGLRQLIKRSRLKIKKKPMGKLFRYVLSTADIETLEKFKDPRRVRNSEKRYDSQDIGTGIIDPSGQVYMYAPWHPQSSSTGRVYEHILVMEKKLKRFLMSYERVEHINGDKSDNRIENLRLMGKQEKHRKENTKLSEQICNMSMEVQDIVRCIIVMTDEELKAVRKFLNVKKS